MIKKSKNGFTLSEVLITLVIIGIIAAITVPVIINQMQEQQYKSALKKNYSVLSQAFKLIKDIDGVNFNEGPLPHTIETVKDVVEKLKNRLNIIKICEYGDESCYIVQEDTDLFRSGMNEVSSFILNDGTSVALDMWSYATVTDIGFITEGLDNRYDFLAIGVDVNGTRKPNKAGKDQFLFVLTNNGLTPAGNNSKQSNKAGWAKTIDYLK